MPVDRLTTIIELQGLAASVSGLKNVAMAATQVSVAFTQMQSGTGGITALATGFTALVQAGQLVMSTFRGIVQSIGAAMDAGDRLNQSLARTLLLYQNAGRAATPGGLSAFALQRLGQAGIAPQQTLDLMGQLAERGFAPRHIQALTQAGQEIEAGTAGRTSALRAIEMFLRGEFTTERQQFTRQGMLGIAGGRAQMQMGTRLGLSIRFTGNIERDLEAFTRAVEDRFGGVTEALNRTASGVHLRVQTELSLATQQLGQLIEAALLPAMEVLARSLQGANVAFSAILHSGGPAVTTGLDLIGRLLPGTLGEGFRGLSEARRREAELNRIDPTGNMRQQLDHLAHIDANTAALAGLLAQTLFGHTGRATQQSFAWDFVRLNSAVQNRT